MFRKYLFIVVLMMFGNIEGVHATLIVDPLNEGAINVFPDVSFFTFLPPTSASTSIFVLGTGGPGAVELNASSDGNGINKVITTSTSESIIGGITSLGSGTGALRVIGDGTSGSASLLSSGGLVIGLGQDGLLEIRDGGLVRVQKVQLGASSGDADIIVDGPTSRLEVVGGDIGFSGVSDADRSLTISNGATASAVGGTFGSNLDASEGDLITITGAGSSVNFEKQVFMRGTVDVIDGGRLEQIERPGLIDGFGATDFNSLFVFSLDKTASVKVSGTDSEISITRNASIATIEDLVSGVPYVRGPTGGSLIIENDGIFRTTRDVIVASNDNESVGTVTVRSGGALFANTLTLFEGGILNGGNGTINANVIVNGGTVAPGNSPGTMTINGDADFSSGILEFEITQAATDLLVVTGDLSFGGDFMLSLLFDFDPVNYILDLDNLFDVSGDFLLGQNFNLLDNLNISGLSNASSLTVNFQSGQRTFGNPGGGSSIPEPAPLALLGLGLFGLGMARKWRR